jgi:hypothetical protein
MANQRGLDLVRLCAMGLVAWQHVQVAEGIDPRAWLSDLDPGELGVTAFCALSGYLAGMSESVPTGAWLRRRLDRIFVPYWMALLAVLLLNLFLQHEPMTLGLVASQVAGVAHFTHPGQVVGAPFWFVTLILVCYGLAALERSGPKYVTWPMVLAIAALGCMFDVRLFRHVGSFLLGLAWLQGPNPAGLPRGANSLVLGLVPVGVATLVAGGAITPGDQLCPVVGGVTVLLGLLPLGESPRWLSRVSYGTYHFFLVHAFVYRGLAEYAGLGLWANVVWGTLAGMVAAWGLLWIEERLRRGWSAWRASLA